MSPRGLDGSSSARVASALFVATLVAAVTGTRSQLGRFAADLGLHVTLPPNELSSGGRARGSPSAGGAVMTPPVGAARAAALAMTVPLGDDEVVGSSLELRAPHAKPLVKGSGVGGGGSVFVSVADSSSSSSSSSTSARSPASALLSLSAEAASVSTAQAAVPVQWVARGAALIVPMLIARGPLQGKVQDILQRERLQTDIDARDDLSGGDGPLFELIRKHTDNRGMLPDQRPEVFDFWNEWLTDLRPAKVNSDALRSPHVYRARVMGSDIEVAIKVVRLTESFREYRLEREVKAMEKLGGADCINIYGAFTAEWEVDGLTEKMGFIFMEAADGTLREKVLDIEVQDKESLHKTKLKLMVELLAAMEHMAKDGVVHRDITPDNIFVFGDCDAEEGCDLKLGDFEHAFEPKSEQGDSTIIGSENYIAPEVYDEKGASTKSDLFSVGIVLYDLFASHPQVFYESRFARHSEASWANPLRSYMPKKWNIQEDPSFEALESQDPELANFLAKLLSRQAWFRPSAAEALKIAKRIAIAGGVDAEEVIEHARALHNRAPELPEKRSQEMRDDTADIADGLVTVPIKASRVEKEERPREAAPKTEDKKAPFWRRGPRTVMLPRPWRRVGHQTPAAATASGASPALDARANFGDDPYSTFADIDWRPSEDKYYEDESFASRRMRDRSSDSFISPMAFANFRSNDWQPPKKRANKLHPKPLGEWFFQNLDDE